MGFEGRGQSGPYIWQDFNSIICDLEKLLRLRKTLYCFNFAVCLISYLYQIVRLWLHWLLSECAWGERKGLTAGGNSIASEMWKKR